MPASHRKHMEWTPQRIIQWAGKTGANVAAYVERLMNTRPHPEQGFKCCIGIIRLGKKVGAARLDAACLRALTIGGNNYRCVANILERGLDRVALPEKSPAPVIQHENVRGPGYYRDDQENGGTDHAESTHH
jgi:transposase